MSDKDKNNVTRITVGTQTHDEKQSRIIVGVIAAVIVLFVFIVIASMNSGADTAQTGVEPKASTEQAETPASDLVKRTEENFLAGWGI